MTSPQERYTAAAHAMQSGVAMKMNYDPAETTPKHLRVGVNSAMADQGALARLLIAKGVITEAEYLEAVADGMEREAAYLVLSDEDRAKGFVRPVRRAYRHRHEYTGCGAVTTMDVALAETYARDPSFYGATYCVGCQMHRRVGEHGEFTWMAADGSDTGELVGT